jgi:hypothetical protein
VFRLFLSVAALLASLAVMPHAALAQGETATAETELLAITPLSLVKEQDLDFGFIIPSTTTGFVTLSPSNVVTTTNGIIVTGTTQNAAFYGYGTFNQRLRIYLNANQYNLVRQGGTQTMRLDQVTIGSTPPVVIGTAPRTFRIASACTGLPSAGACGCSPTRCPAHMWASSPFRSSISNRTCQLA